MPPAADGPHKVLLFIPHLEQGGAERQILELMRRLPPRYAPTLCLYQADDASKFHFASYLPAGEPRHALGVAGMGPVGLRRLIQLLRDERPTILHSYRDPANMWARLATLAAPVPIVLTSVRNRFQGLYGPAELVLQRLSDRVLTNSRGIEAELVNWSRVSPGRVQVINNFVDLERFRPPTDEERAAARAHHGFGDELILVLPGRFAMQKHQLGLGVSLAALQRAGRLPANVRLVLAGRRSDKLYSRVVPLWMRLLGLGDRVIYMDTVKDMVRLYHAADAMVMPSLYEGMPNAVLEAHACGLPAVVSHAANRDGIVIDGVSGYEAPTLRPFVLAEAIGKLVSLTDAERRAMGERGRAHVATLFNPERILAETVALYDQLLAEKGLR